MKIKNLLNQFRFSFRYRNISFSQEGEDILLKRIFSNKKNGFYIDVGAHHPVRFSNTYLLSKNGWRGINIDAMPGSMALFNKKRPNDINIECPISDKKEELVYHIFNEPALNTFSKSEALKKDGFHGYKIISKKIMFTRTLAEILLENLNKNQKIDFISIDVEGFDLRVLKSLDLKIFKPEIILIEDLSRNTDLEEFFNKSEINKYLKNYNYKLFMKTYNTMFFKKNI